MALPANAARRNPPPGLHWLISTWLPPLLGVLVVCGESTQAMGSAHTSSFLRPIFERIFGHINDQLWNLLHHIFRKSGHFCGYGTLSLLFLRAWYRTLQRGAVNLRQAFLSLNSLQLRAAGLAILCTFLVASGDEFHQTFVPGRQGLFSDVLLDTSGGIVFHLLLAVLLRCRKNRTGI